MEAEKAEMAVIILAYGSRRPGGGSGGGATDIRLVNGTWSKVGSLNSRIIIAGGGRPVLVASLLLEKVEEQAERTEHAQMVQKLMAVHRQLVMLRA